MRLFELCGADRDLRFSPFVWRSRLALAHKELEAEGVPTRFLEKEPYAPSGSQTVPVLEDAGRWVSDSWAIACYLEDAYPERASLFGSAIGRGEARFINLWADTTIARQMFPMYGADILAVLDESDQAYFRESREERLGCKLEAARDQREQRREQFQKSLAPLRAMLGEQPYICGESPAYADYCAFSPFIWAYCVSDFDALAGEDTVAAWRTRMFDRFAGMARNVKRAPAQAA